jgi:hypothetical protein
MTLRNVTLFVAVFCISAVMGALLGILCRGRVVFAVALSVTASILLFAAIEWRFGSPEEWSWQFPITSLAYLFAPFVIFVAAPAVGAALFITRRRIRRKVI